MKRITKKEYERARAYSSSRLLGRYEEPTFLKRSEQEFKDFIRLFKELERFYKKYNVAVVPVRNELFRLRSIDASKEEAKKCGLPDRWLRSYRSDRGIWENICPHRVGHPAKESISKKDPGVHGCDGCCKNLKIRKTLEQKTNVDARYKK